MLVQLWASQKEGNTAQREALGLGMTAWSGPPGLQKEQLLVKLRNRRMRTYWVSATGTQSQLSSVYWKSHLKCLISLMISAFTDMMDRFGGQERKEEKERGAPWWLQCQFITVASHSLDHISCCQNAMKLLGGVWKGEQVTVASFFHLLCQLWLIN